MEDNRNSDLPKNDLSSLEIRWLNDKIDKEYKEKYTRILSNMDVRRELNHKPKSIRRSNSKFFLKIAASLLLLIAMTWMFTFENESNAAQFAQLQLSEKFEYSSNRSDGKDAILDSYQNGDYQKCIASINKSTADHSDLFLLGVSHTYSVPPNYILAKEVFEQIVNDSKSEFYEESCLNLAAISFKLDDLEKTKSYLQLIINDKNSRKKQFAIDFFESLN